MNQSNSKENGVNRGIEFGNKKQQQQQQQKQNKKQLDADYFWHSIENRSMCCATS